MADMPDKGPGEIIRDGGRICMRRAGGELIPVLPTKKALEGAPRPCWDEDDAPLNIEEVFDSVRDNAAQPELAFVVWRSTDGEAHVDSTDVDIGAPLSEIVRFIDQATTDWLKDTANDLAAAAATT